jgi:hypothetical protein
MAAEKNSIPTTTFNFIQREGRSEKQGRDPPAVGGLPGDAGRIDVAPA